MQIAKKYSFNSHNLHSIRHWEKQNLPHYGKEVGYLLFLELATFNGIKSEALKAFYLSMPCAESTVRLLLRMIQVCPKCKSRPELIKVRRLLHHRLLIGSSRYRCNNCKKMYLKFLGIFFKST